MFWRYWDARSASPGLAIRPPLRAAGIPLFFRPSCSAYSNTIPICLSSLFQANPGLPRHLPMAQGQSANDLIGDFTMDAPASKSATLTVGNKTYDFPILSGTVGPDVIDIAKLYAQAGMFTYDPGFTSTGSCQSKITYIDGDAGVLEYRGYPIEQLAEHGDFLETSTFCCLAISRPPSKRRISTTA